jgi:hypothetical protein
MRNKFTWREINTRNIGDSSGVYAWYYSNKISSHDIGLLIKKLETSGDLFSKQEMVKQFLLKHVFSFYEEMSYEARISGKLKASYTGQLTHEQIISEKLIDRIVEKPQVLNYIKSTLLDIDESFMSPLYIGMANNLSKRLIKHKRLIEEYRERGASNGGDYYHEDDRDHNFATRIIQKSFIETNLYVVITKVSDENSMHNIMENILNRINYPILGRN